MSTPLNILFVEDSQDDADMLISELRRDGFDLKWKRVQEEKDFLAEIKKLPDIILSDYSMPRFTGLRAAKLLRESKLNIPFILISGTVGEEVAVEAMQYGASDYLLKDRIGRLGSAVKRALDEKQLRRQQQQAEEELQRAHEALRQMVAHSPAVIYTLRIEGQSVVPVLVSENIERMLGFTQAECLSYDWWLGALHPEDRDRVLAAMARGMAEGGHSIEYRIRHKDGAYHWIEDSNRIVQDGAGHPKEIVGVWTDITEHKRAEEILRKTSGQTVGRQRARILRDLAVILGLGMALCAFVFYTDFLVPPINKIIMQFKDNIDDLLLPPIVLSMGLLVFAFRRWKDAKHQVGEQANNEEALRILHSELEKRIQQRTAELTQANEVLRIEIAERKKANETVRQSETRFRELAENINEVFWITDPAKNQMLYISPAYEKIWGQTCESLYAAPREWLEAIHPKDRERVRITAAEKQSSGVYDEEYRIIRPDKTERWVHDRAFPIRNEAGEVCRIVGTAEDITEHKKIEDQFRQAQKLESIGQLAGGVAHDFNNILAVIQMQSELLKSSGELSAEQTEFADDINATVQRATALTRQLLLFSRREVFQPRDLELNETITSTAKMLKRILTESIRIELKLVPQPIFIHADPGMIDQVLMNLSVNARDAMPNGGQLVIQTAGVEFDESAAARTAHARPGSYVCLSVSDTGCGIPPEILPKIFEPFFTTKEAGKGTGLGLATVFGIAQQHQGWINIESEVGRGTTFRIYIPRLAGSVGQKSSHASSTAARGGNETILVAEDDPALRLTVRKVLSQLGYRILEAPTGVKALEVWKQNRDEIQLLLTDLVMPDGMTGKALGQRLLQENPKLKIIYMSGYSDETLGKDFPLKEGSNFLAKPFRANNLAQTIRDSLDSNG